MTEFSDSGLAKLAASPDYGYTGKLTRGVGIDGDVDKIVNEVFPDGGKFSDKTFMSTSYDSKKSFPVNVQVEIETKGNHAKLIKYRFMMISRRKCLLGQTPSLCG